MPLPAFRLANVPAVAVPAKVAESLPNNPEAITGVPVKTASVFLL